MYFSSTALTAFSWSPSSARELDRYSPNLQGTQVAKSKTTHARSNSDSSSEPPPLAPQHPGTRSFGRGLCHAVWQVWNKTPRDQSPHSFPWKSVKRESYKCQYNKAMLLKQTLITANTCSCASSWVASSWVYCLEQNIYYCQHFPDKSEVGKANQFCFVWCASNTIYS